MSTAEAPNTKSPDFAIGTLCRFLRMNYGAEAFKEAQRHVTAYREINQRDIAGIWLDVAEELKKTQS